ncbi:hypothetical protein IMCC26134_04340 [Verrucomicrobia bacterium IMCC26134]|nr:hypothetical protein IMCC26134_04340 [Verrucomicrobia bacterium IMCC26134]
MSLQAVRLQTDRREAPLGIDRPDPTLGWFLEAVVKDARGLRQTACQVLVASAPELLAARQGDLWDTGRLENHSACRIVYAGAPLSTDQICWWTVRVWDQDGVTSPWSPPARWTMGVLAPTHWSPAAWIGREGADATVRLRRSITVRPGLIRALLHVTGLGHYELTANGLKIGEALLAPGWTNYRRTVLYDTFDLTAGLRRGENVLGLLLANGMYNVSGGRYTKFTGSFGPLMAIARLRLDYADGTTEFIGTDSDWRTAAGPITFCCVYGGEDHDARLDLSGWDAPGFDASAWSPAVTRSAPGGELRGVSHAAPPLRTHDTLAPVVVKQLHPGASVYDLGQNASLMPRLVVRGPAGARVRLIPAELVHADGSADRASCGGHDAWWQFTLAGTGADETWFPRFYYHGSRYLQVELTAASEGGELPVIISLAGVVVHTSSRYIGEFECSNPLFNRIRDLVRWAQRSNLVSVITDCPHRERLGWLEQYHLNGPSLRYGFDLSALFEKCFDDMADAQRADGLVPCIAPEYTVFKDGFLDSPEWGSAFILAAWQQYVFTGDDAVLRRHYAGMKRYAAYLGTKAHDHLVGHGLGDWFDLGPKRPGPAQLTPVTLTASAIYYEDLLALEKIAARLGLPEEAAAHAKLAGLVAEAFNRQLYDPAAHRYATGSQTAQSMPLVLGLVPPADREAVLAVLVADIHARQDSITAGDVGYRYLLRALADSGRSDVVYAMNNQSERPGYGYQLAKGATSLGEAWNLTGAAGGASQNHFMLGQIMEWFYHDLAGIQPDPAEPGFCHFIIKPAVVGELAFVRAAHDSAAGRISVEWRRSAGRVSLSVVVPPNTSSTIHVPTSNLESVHEGDAFAAHAPGLTPQPSSPGFAVFTVGSGVYKFDAEL